MPIYEYQCASCGKRQEFLQKISDPPRTRCEHCGMEALAKMVTAAGFQLKGSGWYVTDFRNGGSKPTAKKDGGEPTAAKDAATSSGSDGASPPAEAPKAAPPAAPAAGGAGSASGT